MKAQFDMKQLEEFQKKLEEAGEQVNMDAFYESAAKELAARMLALVKPRTPVGIRPDVDPEVLKTYWSGYQGGTLRRGWDVTSVTKKGNYYEVEVFNPVMYASYVEFGHRQTPGRFVPALGKRLKSGWVKGRFMMKISAQDLEKATPAILQKKLAAYFKEGVGEW